MEQGINIPEPLLFNPLKHHLGYIREFTGFYALQTNPDKNLFLRTLKHTGGSVMDIYSGTLDCETIGCEILEYLGINNLLEKEKFIAWTGSKPDDFKTVRLSDGSLWVVKYYSGRERWAHIFPARMSPHSFRIKANTLRSAILYEVFIGKDFISREGLNKARALGNLSPVKDVWDAEAISAMIELIRG